jgi:hypothetical protein
MSRKKVSTKASEEFFSFDCEEEHENGFSENVEPSGRIISTFSFADRTVETKAEVTERSEVSEKLTDNRRFQKQSYGITPPVEGEHFEVKRTFVFRRSTVRMLNKLKAEHEDENVYLSSIVDEAVRFYYNHVFSK